MPPASAFAAVALGAVLGAWLRWFLVAEFNAVLPHVPLGTLIANVGGGFVIGFAVAWLTATPANPNVRLFIVTGFLGALTTFSSFSAESLDLLQHGRYGWAVVHSAAHLFGSLAAAALGYAVYEAI